MKSKWSVCKLQEIISFKNGKKKPSEKGNIPVYGGNGILGYVNQFNLKKGIAIGRVGAYCGSVYYSDKECWISDNAIQAINNTNSDMRFDYYLLKYLRLNERRIGTGQPLLTQEILNRIEIKCPPLQTQKKIAAVLSALDDKIALNTAINENLEQQAQAIFKSWFVDFEPFGGVMPADWRQGTFSDIIESTLSGDWGKENPTGNYTEQVYCIRGADITEVKVGNKGKMPTRYILPNNKMNKQLVADNIIVEISGGSPTQSTGRVVAISQSLLDRYDKAMICTNFCRAIKPIQKYSKFIYHYWQYLYDRKIFFSYENGTTGIKNLDISGFIETEPITIPSVDALDEFNELTSAFSSQISANGLENEKLSALRDTLLPKLMNGEIDVSEVKI